MLLPRHGHWAHVSATNRHQHARYKMGLRSQKDGRINSPYTIQLPPTGDLRNSDFAMSFNTFIAAFLAVVAVGAAPTTYFGDGIVFLLGRQPS